MPAEAAATRIASSVALREAKDPISAPCIEAAIK
jgi:hypothetical protein